MPVRQAAETCQKAAISVSEMARLCSLSRGHFYALVREGVMPRPAFDLITRRPLYPRELIEECLRVKATNRAPDGRYVIFYTRNSDGTHSSTRPSRRAAARSQAGSDHAEILDGLKALGLQSLTSVQVETALRACYPQGYSGVEEGQVLRTLWQHFRRANVA